MPIRWSALGRVIAEAKPTWMCVGGVLASWVIGWFFSTGCSAAIRYAGTFLQILGLLTLALGLYKMRQSFPRRSGGWFGRLVQAFRRPKPISLQASAASAVIAGARPRLRSGVGPGVSLEDRLGVLEGNLKQLEGEMDAEIRDVKEQVAQAHDGLRREREERSVGDDRTTSQIKEVAIGGLHLEVVGLVWLILGVLGTSIPDETARFLYFIGCKAAPPLPPFALLDVV